MGDSSKKVTVAGLASVLLVAMVVAVTISLTNKDTGDGDDDVDTSNKAVLSLCNPTDYKQTCEKALANTDTQDPKELVKVAFEETIKDIQGAIKNFTAYKEAASDERTKGALDVCDEVLDDSIDDLRRSFDQIDNFDFTKLDEYLEDVKTWLSGGIAHHEACLDAFENTTGDAGEKMKKLLNWSGEMLSNGLAMVNGLSNIIGSLARGAGSTIQRRRLSSRNDVPSFVDAARRRAMKEDEPPPRSNIIVAEDGSGDFRRISDAINSLPKKNNHTIKIHVKAGVYREQVTIPKKVNNIWLIGEGPLKTRISGHRNYKDGTPTYHTATLIVNAGGFMAMDIGIENTAGPEKHQAVAMRVSGDKAVFFNVHMDGYQDTLYAHSYRQYYRDCVITGTIDFIFGDAAAVFQKCKMVVRKPMHNQACMVTAQGRKDKRSVGITLLQNCEILPDKHLKPPVKVYLGRPWKEYSRTIIMHSFIDGFIMPEGWSPWQGDFALNTLYYGEYENRGPGSDTSERVKWKGLHYLTQRVAESFTPADIYMGDEWIRDVGVPYVSGLMAM